jgi:predicted PurR-regulated permease PerM
VTRKQQIGLAIFVACVVIIFYLFFLMLRPYLSYIVWGALLAMIASPLNRRLRGKVPNNNLRAVIMSVIVVALIIVPAVLLTLGLVSEVADMYTSFREASAAGEYDFILRPDAYHWNEKITEYLKPYVDISKIDVEGWISSNLQQLTTYLAGKVSSVVGNVSMAIVSFVFIIFSMFFFIRDGDKIADYIWNLLPMSDDLKQKLATQQREVVEASIYGGLIIAGVQGGLGALIFWILGLPSPLFWGVVMAFLSVIPLVGPWLIYLPAAGILALSGSWVQGIILIVFGSVVVSQADNLLRPVIIGKRAKIPTLILLFSMLGGLKLFGLVGLLLGPIIASMVLTLINFYRNLDNHATGGDAPDSPHRGEGPPGSGEEQPGEAGAGAR